MKTAIAKLPPERRPHSQLCPERAACEAGGGKNKAGPRGGTFILLTADGQAGKVLSQEFYANQSISYFNQWIPSMKWPKYFHIDRVLELREQLDLVAYQAWKALNFYDSGSM